MLPSIFGKDLFDDFFGYPFYTDRDWKKAEKQAYTKRNDLMKTDVRETEDAYQLEMDLPGYKKDEIKVALEKGYLTIHAVKEEKKELLYNHTLKPCELLSFPLDHDLQHDFHIVNKDLLQMK